MIRCTFTFLQIKNSSPSGNRHTYTQNRFTRKQTENQQIKMDQDITKRRERERERDEVPW